MLSIGNGLVGSVAGIGLDAVALGMADGGAVSFLFTEGLGGIRGTFGGGVVLFEVGVAGVGDVMEGATTDPGGGGCGVVAVLLCVPGRTIAVESLTLGLVVLSAYRL